MVRIGIDIGGTFTDIAAEVDGVMHYAKAPSTANVVSGVIEGVARVLAAAGIDPQRNGVQVSHIHGTTIATNALLERKGARLGVLGTVGHQDALELGRMKRTNIYDLHPEPETPRHLAPGRYRIGIRERIDGQGVVNQALDEAQVREAVCNLVEKRGIEGLAVCYLNAYLNPVHEQRTAEIVREVFPNLPVSLSSEVNPVFREYERVCCTALDAYVRPKVEHYLTQLATSLTHGESRLHLMQSRGGITSAALAARRPITMFLSGPAAGVIAGRYVGGLAGRADLITLDVGGTSTDVALVRDGHAELTQEGTIDRYPLRIPMVGMETVGAGGGSIAWVDAGRGLHVGPHSAGSEPGPACYGRGGDAPTATDASVVLGYINPGYFAGGHMRLDPALAHGVLHALGRQIGLEARDAALGVYRILVSQMADAIKLVTVQRGIDPRGFCLVSFGGGGGIYAPAVARELGIRSVLVPASPGTLSAFGLLVSNFEFDRVRTCFVRDAARTDPAPIERLYRELEDEGASMLAEEGLEGLPVEHRRSADMRYAGQAYELEVPVAERSFDAAALATLIEGFHHTHERVYGHFGREREVEIVNLRTVSLQRVPEIPPSALHTRAQRHADATTSHRRATFPDAGEVEVPVYNRSALTPQTRIEGPCIIEQADTTVVLHPGHSADVDTHGHLLIHC